MITPIGTALPTAVPTRIQRRSTPGWNAPLDALGRPPVYVGPGSRWANPFRVHGRYVSRSAFHDVPFPVFCDRPLGTTTHPAWKTWPAWTQTVAIVRDREHATDLFRAHAAYFDDQWNPATIQCELGGRNLMCWCPTPEVGQPDHCHATVLLTLANDGNVA